MKKTANQQIISSDISRYKKNKLAANLALLGLVFNCLYFMLLYGYKIARVGDGVTDFATIRMGFSVIMTLVVLLAAFLASEGVKGYDKRYAIVLIALAAWQIFRIFGYPLYGYKNQLLTVNYLWLDIRYDEAGNALNTAAVNSAEFAILIIYLCASAACFIASAVIGWVRAVQLESFKKQLEAGEVSVETTLKAMDAEDEAAAQPAAATAAEEVQ